MGLPLLVSTQWFSKLAQKVFDVGARKENLTQNGYSRSFKVKYFGVRKKGVTRD